MWRPTARAEDGFTLVELLVVMIIIGILTGIAIPVFLGQRQKAVEASMTSDLRATAQLMEVYHQEREEYPSDFASLVAVVGPDGALSQDNTIQVDAATGAADTFCLRVTSPSLDRARSYDSDAGGLLAWNQACS